MRCGMTSSSTDGGLPDHRLDADANWDALPPIRSVQVPPPHPDWTRHYVTISLLALVALIACGVGVMISNGALTAREARDLAAVVLTPIFTLLGTVIAFFFRSERGGNAQ